MTAPDLCKAGLWDIDPAATCPICGALPDTDCLHYRADPEQLALVLPPGARIVGAPVMHWERWSPDEQFAIDCRYDGTDGWSQGRWVEERA